METGKQGYNVEGPSNRNPTLLIVDDDPIMSETLKQVFEDRYEIDLAGDGVEALEKVEQASTEFACVIMDVKMPRMDGMEASIRIKGIDPSQQIVVHTGFADEYKESDFENLIGPTGFVPKGGAYEQLFNSVQRAVSYFLLNRDSHMLADEFAGRFGIVGHSAAMRDIYVKVKKLAPGGQPILISGESGSGKELFAFAIHELSGRDRKEPVTYNCSQFSGEHFTVEAMGVSPGVYTNVQKEYQGIFERADRGSVFLDEIADLPLDAQAKLLRVLNDGTLRRITDSRDIKVDVRTICASNRPLEKLIEAGSFRKDLFHRLNGSQITLPPLNDRKEDIPALVEYFAKYFAEQTKLLPVRFENKAVARLIQHDWSDNNVRQLRNCVESIIRECGSNIIMVEDVAAHLEATAGAKYDETLPTLKEQLGMAERDIIISALVRNNGVAKDAAADLDIDRGAFTRKLVKHDIDLKSLKRSLRRD